MEVEAVMAPESAGKGLVPRCTICGAVIEESASQDLDQLIPEDEISFSDESISVPTMDNVMVVGYSPGVRQLLVDKMTERHVAREIVSLQNGEELIVNIIDRLNGSQNGASVDLIVIDVPMPFLNGINAAIGLRAMERTYPEHDLIPILFLTNKPCDDTFKKVIRYLAPAKYATLGPVDDHEKLIKHLHKILSLVAQEKW